MARRQSGGAFFFAGLHAGGRLPAAAADSAGESRVPTAGARAAAQPAAAGRDRPAGRNPHRDPAATADASRHGGRPGGRDAAARDPERIAVGGIAMAGLGDDQDVPYPIVAATPRPGVGDARGGQCEKGDDDDPWPDGYAIGKTA